VHFHSNNKCYKSRPPPRRIRSNDDKILMKIRCVFFQRCETNCGICPISQCWGILQKSICPDPDFQNLITSSLSTDTFVVKFSQRSD